MLAWRPWLLTGLVALAAVLGGCDSGPTQYLSDRMKKKAPRCAEAFSAALSADTPAPGSVPGEAVAFIQYDDSQIPFDRRYEHEKEKPVGDWQSTLDFNILPSRIRAWEEKRVKALVCIRVIANEVGTYVPVSPDPTKKWDVAAHREDWDVRVMRWPSGELIAGQYFQGPDPPVDMQTNDPKDRRSGGPPTDAMNRWLDTLFAPFAVN